VVESIGEKALFQLTYVSTATPGIVADDVTRILLGSRANNRRHGISGLLLFDGKRFLQVLEGDQAAVERTYLRIRADGRHRAAVQLSARIAEDRCFGNWAMAYHAVPGQDREALAREVDDLVRGVGDVNLRALFSSFARLDRSAA
jgi:hypothetical protein